MKRIRQSQLISPWGIGQIVNFPNGVSLMVCGLDAWEESYKLADDEKEFVIREERLENQLGVNEFRLPPDYRQKENGMKNTNLTIPFVNFPLWYYCPRCGWMTKRTLYSGYSGRSESCIGHEYKDYLSCHDLKRGKPKLIPVRFVAVCEDGHIEDFPFIEWVHKEKQCSLETPQLRMITGKSSSLSGIEIRCKCGARRNMGGSFNSGSLDGIKKCSGHRPWLGEVDDRANPCGKDLKVVQKGASNVYFPLVKSAIFIPKFDIDSKLIKAVEKFLHYFGGEIERSKEKTLDFFEEKIALIAKEFNVDKQRLKEAVIHVKNTENKDTPKKEESLDVQIRKPEYNAILSETGGDRQDLYVKIDDVNHYQPFMKYYFSNIALVHKLKETRAFVGFSRITPPSNDEILQKKFNLTNKRKVDWLPAIVVKGEGIFIDFNKEKLEEWANRSSVERRIKKLESNLRNRTFYYDVQLKLNPKFVLLHTFAHLLINQLSYECGYGSSSLRERIYCSQDGSDEEMSGILIYTSSNSSEGSLGGLVRQGLPKRLENVIIKAIQKARWCSSDPICIQSNGQGPDSCNLAACHNCTLIPETSCEFGNRMLDRALIIGSYDDDKIGYFSDLKNNQN